MGRGLPDEFILHEARELLHLFFHLEHLLAHVQNDFDAGEIDAHVAREREDHFEAFEIGSGVEARIALRAGGLEQTYSFVEAESLRVDLVQLRDSADHVADARLFARAAWRGCASFRHD